MKKKEVLLICSIVIATVLSLIAIWSTYNANKLNNTSTNNSSTANNSTASNNKDLNDKTKSGNGPTIIDNSSDKDSSSKSTVNTDSSSTANASTNNKSTANTTTDTSKDTSSINAKAPISEEYIAYTVKKDDTLLTICKTYSSTCPKAILSKAILELNYLNSSSDIKEGLSIKIPKKYTVNGICYKVKKGDSISSIAHVNMPNANINSATDIIMKDNYLTNSTIKIGDELFIPVSTNNANSDSNSTPASSNINSNASATTNSNLTVYKVQKNDTLASICSKYEKYCPSAIVEKTILKINNLSSSKDVKEGLSLNIPINYFTSGQLYTVKSGDSLSSIAVSNIKNLSMNKAIVKIEKDNYLSSDKIYLGQHLFISTSTYE